MGEETPRRGSVLLWLRAALVLGTVCSAAAVADDRPQQHTIDFRAGLDKVASLRLFGPDADAVVKTDARGLRMTLPAQRPDPSPVGVEWQQRLQGDFDISLGYELVTIGEPAPTAGAAGVACRVVFDTPTTLVALISRGRRASGEEYGLFRIAAGPDGKDKYHGPNAKAAAAEGRLRLVRTGDQLQYWVAEGKAEYKQLHVAVVGKDDVKAIRVYVNTAGKKIPLDVRVSDLVVQAEQLPGMAPVSKPAEVQTDANEEPAPTFADGRLATAIVLLLLLLVAAVLGVWLYARRGSPSAALSPFTCPGCHKKLRAKASAAGKKIKCPQCGKPVLVPLGEENSNG